MNRPVIVRLQAGPSFRGGAAEPGIQSGEERGFAPRFATATRSKPAIAAKSPSHHLWIPGSASRPRNDGAKSGCARNSMCGRSRRDSKLNRPVIVRLQADPSFRGDAAEPGIQSGEERGFAPRFATATRSKPAIPAKSPSRHLWIPGSASRPRNDGAKGGCAGCSCLPGVRNAPSLPPHLAPRYLKEPRPLPQPVKQPPLRPGHERLRADVVDDGKQRFAAAAVEMGGDFVQ